MTWVTEDGRHEGYAAYVTVDGREAVCTTSAGMHLDHRSVFNGSRWVGGVIRPWSELLGWEARCTCGWVGPLWRRLAGSDAQDACEVDWDGMTVEDAVHEVWKRHAEPRVSDPNGPFAVHRAQPANCDHSTALERLVGLAEQTLIAVQGMADPAEVGRQLHRLGWSRSRSCGVMSGDLEFQPDDRHLEIRNDVADVPDIGGEHVRRDGQQGSELVGTALDDAAVPKPDLHAASELSHGDSSTSGGAASPSDITVEAPRRPGVDSGPDAGVGGGV